MKHKPIEDIVRDAASQHSTRTPSSVWDRVESQLPASQARVRQLNTQKASRFPAIAASLLAVVVATWWLLSGIESKTNLMPLSEMMPTQEGSLEIVEQPKPVFSDALYNGVHIKDGAPGVQGELRACVRC